MYIKPIKLLETTIISINPTKFWEDESSINDPWFGFPYIFELNVTVNSQIHSSSDTRIPFIYDSDDVEEGDWIASGIGGRALIITKIIYSDGINLHIEAEDLYRFNTITDNQISGYGGIDVSSGYIFTLDDNGVPNFIGLNPNFLTYSAVTDLYARFSAINPKKNYNLKYQSNHGFQKGDLITIKDGRYDLSKADDYTIGVVTSINIPGLDNFTYEPFGEYFDNIEPPLDGEFGTIHYIDPDYPGKITPIKPNDNIKPIYIQLETPNTAIRLNTVTEVSSETGKETKMFKVENVNLEQVIFQLPEDANNVLVMSINGIENKNYEFDNDTKILTFDPEITGYGLDESDEVIFTYTT